MNYRVVNNDNDPNFLILKLIRNGSSGVHRSDTEKVKNKRVHLLDKTGKAVPS